MHGDNCMQWPLSDILLNYEKRIADEEILMKWMVQNVVCDILIN